VRLRVRWHKPADPARQTVPFNTGLTGPAVNNFVLSYAQHAGVVFAVQSQRFNRVAVALPPGRAGLAAEAWHEVCARWGGFNDAGG
jgi:hypothetical protein